MNLIYNSYMKIPNLFPHILIIPTLIPFIPTLILHISIIPILIPRILTLIPHISVIPLISFPDSPFRLLQIAPSLSIIIYFYYHKKTKKLFLILYDLILWYLLWILFISYLMYDLCNKTLL